MEVFKDFLIATASATVASFLYSLVRLLVRRRKRSLSGGKQAQGKQIDRRTLSTAQVNQTSRPPINAEYLLHLLLRKGEREAVIGDLVECYGQMVRRFGKRRADIWFYKQVAGSLFPLVRRAVLRVAAFAWLGRVLRRIIS